MLAKISPKGYLYLLLFWTFYAGLVSFSSYVYYFDSGVEINWAERIISNLPGYLVWTLIVPLAYNLYLNFPFDQKPKFRNALIAAGAGLIIAALHRTFSIAAADFIRFNFFSSESFHLWDSILGKKFAILSFMFDSYFMFWAIMAAIYGFEYYKRFNDNRIQVSELRTKLSEAQLETLRNQINPHFLFNALNSISSLVYKSAEEADKMITKLSDMLRATLQNEKKQFSTLEEEIRLLKLYFDIQKIRFKDRLQVCFATDPNTLGMKTPSFILQPIAENSIKHVLEKNKSTCKIDVYSSIENSKLVLVLKDSGEGFDLSELYDSEGIGLSNIKNRLEKLYDQKASINFSNDDGFAVEIIIPAESV